MSSLQAVDSHAPRPAPRIQFTESFATLLEQLGCSIAVTTYQANKLAIFRADRSGQLDVCYWDFPKPMGLAADRQRLAIGTTQQIRHYRRMEPIPRSLQASGRFDSCYLPRIAHITGDIDIHEMAWADEELWFVNTRFSCLCTLNHFNSFVPRWRPPFVTALSAEDRCHLNGFCLGVGANGKVSPRYVTVHGAADTPEGWRAGKRNGGLVLDVASGETVASGLSMPHSPRLHAGRLWVLESGEASIGFVTPDGRFERIAQLAGFTRGLDLIENFAFVGLSLVRDTARFSGIAIADRALAERVCGVWVVNIDTGATVALARFEDQVEEVFAVQVLPGIRFPEICHDSEVLANAFDLPLAALNDTAPVRQPGQDTNKIPT